MASPSPEELAKSIAEEVARSLAMEVGRQLTDGNGLSTAETRGMTLRELVLENRNTIQSIDEKFDVHLQSVHTGAVTHKQLAGVLATLTSIGIALINIF